MKLHEDDLKVNKTLLFACRTGLNETRQTSMLVNKHVAVRVMTQLHLQDWARHELGYEFHHGGLADGRGALRCR